MLMLRSLMEQKQAMLNGRQRVCLQKQKSSSHSRQMKRELSGLHHRYIEGSNFDFVCLLRQGILRGLSNNMYRIFFFFFESILVSVMLASSLKACSSGEKLSMIASCCKINRK